MFELDIVWGNLCLTGYALYHQSRFYQILSLGNKNQQQQQKKKNQDRARPFFPSACTLIILLFLEALRYN